MSGTANRASIGLAKIVLRLAPAAPPDPDRPRGLQEIFEHERFRRGSDGERARIMEASARFKYEEELDYPWDHYYGLELRPLLEGKKALDLGCLTGGRSVAWAERYGLGHVEGIDVAAPYIEAARRFAAARGVRAGFRVSRGEQLPFSDSSFDAVLSFDVFEHVQDVRATLTECRRVLRPGGRLFVVFPSYFQPNEHHLGLASRLPGVQLLLPGSALVAAYAEILQERGPEHAWYARKHPERQAWERGNTINGTTFASFRRMMRDSDWRIHHRSRAPLFAVGRNVTRRRWARIPAALFAPLAKLPILEEVFCHRIACILEKPG